MSGITVTKPVLQENAQSGSDWGAPLFVWGVWVLVQIAAIALAWRYGSSIVPWQDEWAFISVLTGNEPLTVAWLWEHHWEHRIAVGKLAWILLVRLFDGNLRAVMIFNIFVLGALASALILTSKRIHGRIRYTDAFFPLALINLGNWMTYTFSSIVIQVLTMVPIITLLIIVVRCRTQLKSRDAIVAGLCLALLPLCGGYGLLLVPALSLWLAYIGVSYWLSPQRRGKRESLIMFGGAAIALLIEALYFTRYKEVAGLPPHPGVKAAINTILQFFSVSLGLGTEHFWWLSGLGVLSLVCITLIFLIAVWLRRPNERFRALGFFLFIGAIVSLALVAGIRRAAYGGLQAHYMFFILPALFCVYYVWGIYAARNFSRFVQTCLFTAVCAMLFLNVQAGLKMGRYMRQRTAAFERDLLAGTPPSVLSERYSGFLFPYTSKEDWAPAAQEFNPHLASWMLMLRSAGIGQFKHLKNDPAFREVSLPVAPISVSQITWDGSTAHAYGNDPSLTFALKEPRFIYAVRLKYSYGDTSADPESFLSLEERAGASFQMFWRDTTRNDFTNAERNVKLKLQHAFTYQPTGPGERTVTIWVNDVIDHFRLHPDNKPCDFKISEIVLLVPETDSQVSYQDRF